MNFDFVFSFLGKHGSNEGQYRSLLDAAAAAAGHLGLQVGVALTDDQMKRLTTDIVWLVEQTVTLPDGTKETVLAPRVYLVVRPDDLRGDGTLIAARETYLSAFDGVENTGTLGAREALVIAASDIRNKVGSIHGKTVDLDARRDIENLAGLIKGDAIWMSAARDINQVTSTHEHASGGISSTRIDGLARIDAGSLVAKAGRDFNARAAHIETTRDALIHARRDIDFGTADQRYAESHDYGRKNNARLALSSELGTILRVQGSAGLVAERDANLRAADVFVEKHLTLLARRDVKVFAGESSEYVRNELHQKQRGFLARKSMHIMDERSSTSASGTRISADSATIVSGRDSAFIAAQVSTEDDLFIDAGRDLYVEAGVNTYSREHYSREKKSGVSGKSYNSADSKRHATVQGTSQSDARSQLGSVSGNVDFAAARHVRIIGSDVVAGSDPEDTEGHTGNIRIKAQDVHIGAARDAERTHDAYSNKNKGVGFSVTGRPDHQVTNIREAGSLREKGAQLGHSGATSPGISFNYGSNKSSGTFDSESEVSSGSSLTASSYLLIRATGTDPDNGDRSARQGEPQFDIRIEGSNLHAQNDLQLEARNGIHVGVASNSYDESSTHKSKGKRAGLGVPQPADIARSLRGQKNEGGAGSFPYGREQSKTHDHAAGTWETSSHLKAANVLLRTPEGDIRIVGSAIDADKNVYLQADQRSVHIVHGKAEREHSASHRSDRFGDLGSGNASVTVGRRKISRKLQETSLEIGRAGSSVVAREGDVKVVAGEQLQVSSSEIRAAHDVRLIAQRIIIDGYFDTEAYRSFQKFDQVGVTTSVNNPLLSAAYSIDNLRDAAKDSGDARLQALAATAAGLAAKNAADAVAKNPSQLGGVSVNIDVGMQRSQQRSEGDSRTARGSNVEAGQELFLIATGGGDESDIVILGSNLKSGGDTLLYADSDIFLSALQSSSNDKSDSSGSSASVGVGVSFGSQIGFTINLAAGGSRGTTRGSETRWQNTHVNADKKLTLHSGHDTRLTGAVASGERILAIVEGDLSIESLQDISKYVSRDRSFGVQVSLCIPPICYGASSASANYAQGKLESEYQSVREQSGLVAGDGGFQVDVKGHTKLIGGLIASSPYAEDQELNSLRTATLESRDIDNHAWYRGYSVNVGGGYSWGGNKSESKDTADKPGAEGANTDSPTANAAGSGNTNGPPGALGTDKDGNVASGSKATPGSSVPSTNGFGASLPFAAGASGDDRSKTRSGISSGHIEITDDAAQRALTGQTAAEAIASLNRDTGDTLNALDRIFDEKKIRNGFRIVQETSNQFGQFIANRAVEADDIKKAMLSESDPARYTELERRYQDAKRWLPGGVYRQIATAVMAATSGNVSASSGELARSAVVNYLQQLGAVKVGEWVDRGLIREGSIAHVAMQSIVACAGAAASQQSCGSGAMGAAAAVIVNRLLADATDATHEHAEARRNLITTVIAGAYAALGNGADAVMINSAIAELDNNSLNVKLHRGFLDRLADIDLLKPEAQEDLLRELKAAHGEGRREALDAMTSVFGPDAVTETIAELKALQGSGSACGQVPACALQLTRSIGELHGLLTQYETLKDFTPKVEVALEAFDLATVGVVGAARKGMAAGFRMLVARISGRPIEMTAAKMAYADGAAWTVRNGEILTPDGVRIARQSPLTGEYEAFGRPLGSKAEQEFLNARRGALLPRNNAESRVNVGADSAQNIANAQKLNEQLRLESANSPFAADGTLTPDALHNAKPIPGLGPRELKNANIPAGLGKYTSEIYQSPSGPFEIHFYMNPATKEVYYGMDYKVIFGKKSGMRN